MSGFDWNALWQKRRGESTCKFDSRDAWDRKAKAFAMGNRYSLYVDRLLTHIQPLTGHTILDVGAGPGTLTIPLAGLVKTVTALDYSEAMLAELQEEAQRRQLNNIIPIRVAWEDDWCHYGITRHDIALASRSLAIDDLEMALKKLNNWAKKRVIVTERVGPGAYDPDVFAAVKRPFDPGPDYIFPYSLLRQIGICAEINFIDGEISTTYPSRQAAFDYHAEMLDDLSTAEKNMLWKFLSQRLHKREDEQWEYVKRYIPRWAVLSWNAPEYQEQIQSNKIAKGEMTYGSFHPDDE